MYDVAVIGGGPGGYVAAIRAGQLGLKTICIDKEKRLGGTCLNVGCIPSKTLLHTTEQFEYAKAFGTVNLDFSKMMENKEQVIDQLAKGIEGLFRKNKVERLIGEATLTGPNAISVGGATVEAKQIILATGSEPIPLPFLPFDEKKILSSTGALALPEPPKKLLLVGAGVVGLELGSVYRRLGTEVEVIEFLDHICPSLDTDLSKALQKVLERQGMTFYLSKKVIKGNQDVTLEVEGGQTFTGDVALVCIGRRPYTKNLGLDKLGIRTDPRGVVEIDGYFRTSVPNIYAIGDIVDGPWLAHKASEEGIAVAEIIAGQTPHIHYPAIPLVIYTSPEVACVGLTEQQAKQSGLVVNTGTFPFKANSRARATGEDEGMVKIIAEQKTDRIVGMHILGAHAGEMISEGVVAIEKGVTARELAAMSHPHPTFAEAIKEAALAVHKSQIHL